MRDLNPPPNTLGKPPILCPQCHLPMDTVSVTASGKGGRPEAILRCSACRAEKVLKGAAPED